MLDKSRSESYIVIIVKYFFKESSNLIVSHETIFTCERSLEALIIRLIAQVSLSLLARDESSSIERKSKDEFVSWSSQLQEVINRELDVVIIIVLDRSIQSNFSVPGAEVIVAHDVHRVKIWCEVVHAISRIYRLLRRSERRTEMKLVLLELCRKFLD